MCGKDWTSVFGWSSNMGSPPHVRERPDVEHTLGLENGITPTCAGKTARIARKAAEQRDHPRMCGKD